MKPGIVIIILLFITTSLFGQNVRFEQITNESGRSLGFVSGMVQDSTGFMWLATRNGLYRYDGYSYRLFRHDRKDSTSIPYNDLTYLYLDQDEHIWLRHYNRLFAFQNEQLTGKFPYVTENTFDINTRILQDKFKNYWIGPVKDQLIRYRSEQEVDTFTLAQQLIHPGVIKWLKQNEPESIITNQQKIEVGEKQQFLIVSCGEGSDGNFYDYGTILQGNDTIYNAKNSFHPIQKGSLFRLSTRLVELEAGVYTIHFESDGSNSFEDTENPLSGYGVAIFPVNYESEIAKLSQVAYYPEKAIHAAAIKDLYVNNEGFFTLLTENGIHVFSGERWESIDIDFRKKVHPDIIEDGYNMPLIQGANGNYWIGTHNGLIQVFANGRSKEHAFFNAPVRLFNIQEDHKGRIWLATSNGLHAYSPATKNVVSYRQNNKNRLYSNNVRNILEDRSHNLWIATKEGLNRIRPPWFHYADLGMNNYAPFPILKISDNQFLTAGKTGMLHYFSSNENKNKTIEIPQEIFPADDFTGEPEYDVTDMMLAGNRMYMTFSDRVAVFSYPALELIRYRELPELKVGGQSIDNHALYLVKHGDRVWVIAVDAIYAYDKELLGLQDSLTFGVNYSSVFDIDNRFVKDLDPWQDHFLLRTSRNILLFNPDEKSLTKLFAFPESIRQTSQANGDCFIDSSKSALWFAVIPDIYRMSLSDYKVDTFNVEIEADLGDYYTKVTDTLVWVASNNGLIKFNPQTNDFVRYNSSDGLAANNVNGVYTDIYQNLWITSLKGLTKMNVVDEQTETYFRSDDFHELHFLKKHYRHPDFDHHLLLPTTSGYMQFNPDSLNPFKPPLAISNIYLFGKKASFDSLAHQKEHIELQHNENFITFELASLDYTEPSKNMFRYKMKNFNDQWIYTDANNRKAPYTGLPPGDYVFVAQGTNNDGVWSDPLSITVIIHPPWYRTTVAYISYVIFIILSIVFYIRYRERKLKHEKKVLEQKVRERTAEISRQRDKIAAQNKDITDSIHYASRIQSALLPSDEFAKSVLDSYFILFKPRDIVSGDYYWLTQIGNKTIVVAADCTGHGVPGAFMSMLGVAFLNEIVVRDKTLTTNAILDRLREYVIKSLKQTGEEGGSKDGMDIALTIINHDTLEAEFSGAYNPLYVLRDGEIETIKADRMPIGYHIKVDTPFTRKEVKLQKGDRLYMFSDGYPDQFGGEDGRKYMSKRFKRKIIETGTLSMSEQKQALDESIEEWKGDRYEQIDDIIVIGVQI
ncbi:SpoIIE family protein phosphatase [Salinivirga cyanobacteriivorans]